MFLLWSTKNFPAMISSCLQTFPSEAGLRKTVFMMAALPGLSDSPRTPTAPPHPVHYREEGDHPKEHDDFFSLSPYPAGRYHSSLFRRKINNMSTQADVMC